MMRMLLYGWLLTITLMLHASLSVGDENSHRTAAENLIIVLEVDKSLEPLVEHVLENQLQKNPQLAPQRDILRKFLTKYLSWASVRQETITAYTQEFTEPELEQLTEFYATPVGKKANEKMPKLMFIAGQIGLQKAQANQAELQQMLNSSR
jgi:uncharacterized protein